MESLARFKQTLSLALLTALPSGLLGAEQGAQQLELTGHWVGWLAIGVFVLAYLLVMAE